MFGLGYSWIAAEAAPAASTHSAGMDLYQFIAALAESVVKLGWPAAVFGIFLMFKGRLTELLPLLRFKYKDLDIAFSERLESAERAAAALPAAAEPRQAELQPTPEEVIRFRRLAELSPRAAILDTWSEVEQVLRNVAGATQVATVGKGRVLSPLQLLRELRNKSVLDGSLSALLDDLRALRNAAVNGDGNKVVSAEEALQFRALAEEAISRLEAIERGMLP